ncbi:MAG: hypothetical protein DDT21_01419 [Syntrophomonadaceae bacterium]|nr:hypothetical protein [Bacillota bacterium]
MPDKKLTCKDCQRSFLFTEREQKDFALNRWDPPKRCPDCRAAKKVTAPSAEMSVAKAGVTQSRTELAANFSAAAPTTRAASVPDRIPADYLHKGYFDQRGLLRREIFASEARNIANVLNIRGTTSTRLRSFYNTLEAINYHLQQTGDFNNTKVKLASFQSTVEYAKARKVVPSEFHDFIERNLPLAEQDSESFAGFLEHYKSVIAYAKTDKNFSAGDWIAGQGLPPNYLKGSYYDENGYLRRETIIEWPKVIVDIFAQAFLSSTALRRFYNKLKGLDTKFQFNREFYRLLPNLYAFERDAAYAAARQVVPGVFIGFVVKNVDLASNDEKGFKGFVDHFQSIVAFAKGKLKEGGKGE